MKLCDAQAPEGRFFSLILLLIISGMQIMAQSPPDNLRCYDKYNPVGTEEDPYFGWYMNDPADDQVQTAYQVLVASDESLLNEDDADLWNSGKVVSRMQNFIFYEGNPLSAASKYFWKVKVWNKDDVASTYSSPATFATGLFENEDWVGAKWIKRVSTTGEDYTYYRKSFSLENKSVKRATVYLSAVHDFDLYINGKQVGKGPAYHYPQYQYYNAYEITDELLSGSENLFACLTHWYGGGQGRPKSERGFILKSVIEYADGTEQVIGTDESWKQIKAEQWKTGQPVRNGEGIGFVDYIYSTRVISDWNKLDFLDTAWSSSVEIGSHPSDPWTGKLQANLTRIIEEEISPVSVHQISENNYVIDLGKVYAGVPKITFSGGAEGGTTKILGGYTLKPDGSVSTTTTQSTNMAYYFEFNGDSAVFQPFVYLGMRYIQVFNSPNVLTIENCKFITRHYELDPERSEFESSDQMLKAVWDLMKHSLILGSQESFVDTPTREKGGFLGDSWSIGVPAMSTMGDRNMNRRILLEFLDSQDQYWEDGRLNAVYPNTDGARDIPDYTQMYLLWVWDYYLQSGDLEFLRDNYSRLKEVAEYVEAYKNESTGLIHNLDGGGGAYLYGIIDWPEQMRYGYDMSVVSRTVQDVYAYRDFQIISNIAGLLDNVSDESLYQEKADAMKTAINDLLLNDDGMYVDGIKADLSQSPHVSQQANMFPLAAGIVPQENVDSVLAKIKELEMSSGMVTLRMLPDALGKAEDGLHLLKLYTKTEWDGWAKTIDMGGTATWESWDAPDHDHSMSHPWGAVGLLAMQEYFLGVKVLEAQHELIQIKPLDFKYRLKDVSGILPTDRGDIQISWVRDVNSFNLDFTIPDNMEAEVYIPMSGVSGTTVIVDGVETVGVQEGDFIYLGRFGSGSHSLERNAETVELSNDCSAMIEADVGTLVQIDNESYTLDIPRGEASIINFTVTPTHEGARSSGEKIFNISGFAADSSDVAEITVMAEDGTSNCVYSIEVNVLPSNNCSASLKVDEGRLIKDDSETYHMQIVDGDVSILNFTVSPVNDGASIEGDLAFDLSGIAPGSSDEASIIVTAEDGTTTCVYTITVEILVGIESNPLELVRISPNPVKNTLNVSRIKNAKLSIYELTGQLLKNIISEEDKLEINVADLSSGIYMLVIQMDEGISVTKFIKE